MMTRQRLDHEQPADDRQHELMVRRDRDRAQRAAQRKASGIAHEHRSRRRVEPQKGEAADGQTIASRSTVRSPTPVTCGMPRYSGEFHVADEIGDQCERERGNDDRHRHHGIEPIGQIYRIAEGDDNERAEGDVEPAEANTGPWTNGR